MKHFLWLLIIPFLFLAFTYTGNTPSDTDSITTEIKEELTWYPLGEAQELAEKNGKKVIVYAMAEWCGYCKKMEKEVFPEQDVINTLEEYYYPVTVNIESDKMVTFNGETMTEQQFARKFRVTGTPTFFFVDDQGEVLGMQPGYIPADVFKQLLAYVGSDAYTEVGFEQYMEGQEDDSLN